MLYFILIVFLVITINLRTIFIITFLFNLFSAFEVALFASSGCYSHDVMMKEVGQLSFNGHNLSWFQARVYEFDAKPVELPADWNKIVLDRAGQEGLFSEKTLYTLNSSFTCIFCLKNSRPTAKSIKFYGEKPVHCPCAVLAPNS